MDDSKNPVTVEEARANWLEHTAAHDRLLNLVSEGMMDMDCSEAVVNKGKKKLSKYYPGFQGWRIPLLDIFGPVILLQCKKVRGFQKVQKFTRDFNNWFDPINTWQSFGTEGRKEGIFDILKQCMPDLMINRKGIEYLKGNRPALLPRTPVTPLSTDNENIEVITSSERYEMSEAKDERETVTGNGLQPNYSDEDALLQFLAKRDAEKSELADLREQLSEFKDEADRLREQFNNIDKELIGVTEESLRIENRIKMLEETTSEYDKDIEIVFSVLKKHI